MTSPRIRRPGKCCVSIGPDSAEGAPSGKKCRHRRWGGHRTRNGHKNRVGESTQDNETQITGSYLQGAKGWNIMGTNGQVRCNGGVDLLSPSWWHDTAHSWESTRTR